MFLQFLIKASTTPRIHLLLLKYFTIIGASAKVGHNTLTLTP